MNRLTSHLFTNVNLVLPHYTHIITSLEFQFVTDRCIWFWRERFKNDRIVQYFTQSDKTKWASGGQDFMLSEKHATASADQLWDHVRRLNNLSNFEFNHGF